MISADKYPSLLVLGAGVYQVPLIRAAKRLGYRVLVTSRPGRYPGIAIADEFYPIDTTEITETLSLARQTGICGVVTAGTDVAVPTLGRIVDELGLSGPTYTAARACSNKVLMKETLRHAGIPTAEFSVETTLFAAEAAANRIGYPVMIKAVDSSGSRGVTRVDQPCGLGAAWRAAREVSRVQEVLVEKCLEGLEFGVQCILLGDEAILTIPHNDDVTPPPMCTPYGHSLPADLPPLALSAVKPIGARISRAFGLTNTALNLDLIWANGEAYVLEVGARIGATCLPELVGAYGGFDVYDVLIRLAVGERIAVPFRPGRPVAAVLIRSREDGVLMAAKVPDALRSDPDVLEWQIDLVPGDAVRRFRAGPDRIGHIVVQGDSVQAAERKAKGYAAAVAVTTGNKACDGKK